MLSRLSGLASTVLQELSGEGEDAGIAVSPPGSDVDSTQQNEEEAPEDVRERLTHLEKLVAQLKSLAREKDAQLQQQDAALQEERQAAEAKLLKLKLQAKAKVAMLNKRIEELAEGGAAARGQLGEPGEPLPPPQADRQGEEVQVLRRQLREQEDRVGELQAQLEAAMGGLDKAQAQLSSLQEEMQEKEALQHQAESHQSEARSALEAETQQSLRLLQKKLEEQEAALLGRTQSMELLQQELRSCEEEKQVLLEKFQEAEVELGSLRSSLASHHQEAQRLELQLAEQKMAFHRSEEEVEALRQELAQARVAQAEGEQERWAAEARHAAEMAEKSRELAELQKAEQDLRSSYEAVQAENAQLRQEAELPSEPCAEDGSVSPGKLAERPTELSFSQPEPDPLLAQAAFQLPPLSQPSAGRSLEEPLNAEEKGQLVLLDSLAEKKQSELSILLLELQEAQEEIAFLKGQLPLPGSLEADRTEPLRQPSEGRGPGREGEGAVPIQSDSSSSSLVTVDIQDFPVLGMPPGQEDNGPSPVSALHLQKLAELELEVAALRASQQEAADHHGRVLEEKSAEMGRLQGQLEDAHRTVQTLGTQREQLLSQLEELCFLTELREQAKQPDGDLACGEKQQLSDYESGISHLALLKEQIQSLRNEAKSKEVKIIALQKDLDEAQGNLLEQEMLGKNLLGQLQKEEQEAQALAGQVQEASAKAEELSQSLARRELEATKLEKLVSESSMEVERLRQEVMEREQRMAEVSTGMSDRMVQLNEEKLVLGKELRRVMEELSVFQQGKETREQAVETEEEQLPFGEDVEVLRKENEVRRELLGKACQVEQEGEAGREITAEAQENEDAPEGSRQASGKATVKRSRSASLSQLFSAKETLLQTIPGEKESTWLQTVIMELQQSLQQKDLLIGALKAELEDHSLAPEKQTLEDRDLEGSSSAVLLAGEASSKADADLEDENRTIQEEISSLVQEREQLQRKLQEALISRKDTIKKAKEKDRHHREQLKQQKEDYSLLQEQFEQQSREKESLQDQLQALSKALESCSSEAAGRASPGPALGHLQESGPEVSVEDSEHSVVEQLKADFEALQAERRELEAQISHLEGEVGSKSQEALLLQEKVRRLLVELETAKAACCQAEASVASLRLDLQRSREELARQESLRHHQEQVSREEIEGLNSKLADRNGSLCGLQAELQEREERIKALQGQVEQAQRLQAELQPPPPPTVEEASESQSKAQLQRKLQAALISRKELLKESRVLKDQLAGTKATLESTSLHLLDVESQVSELEKEKVVLLEKLATLGEERERLISEVDKALVENQSVTGSCESLKLALEGVTWEKTRLEEEVGSLQRAQAQELSEWQQKREEMQKEYETLLQSYENVSNEAERIQRVVESVRQEKQELVLRLKEVEAEKREGEARLQAAEQEMEGMKEKMRKFAKSKQQKILELEEENDHLRSEVHAKGGRQEGINSSLQEELESSVGNCRALSDQLKGLMAERDSLNQEIQGMRQALQSQEEGTGQKSTQEEMMVGESKVVSPMVTLPPEEVADAHGDLSTGPELLGATSLSLEKKEEASAAFPLCEERNEYIQQMAQLQEQVAVVEEKGKVAEEEAKKARRDLEAMKEEKKGLEASLAAKDQELAALQEKFIQIRQTCGEAEERLAEELRLKEALEAEKDDLEERLMNQLAELNGSIGNYQQDVVLLQSKNQQLLSQVESLQGALKHLEHEKQHLLREVGAEKKENLEKLKSAWKGDSGRTQAKELQELLKEKQQEVKQLQKDCIKSQEKISSLERTLKAMEFVQSESKRELEATKKSLVEAGENTKKAQAELASCKVLLDDTQCEAARVLAESLKVKEQLQAAKAQLRAQLSQKEKELERCLEEEKVKHLKEIRNVEEQVEALQTKQVCAEESARELQESLRQKNQEARQLQSSLSRALAQLAAFTKSMSSLQDDRDRVIDESRRWEKKFTEGIEKKEQELHAREQACAALEDQAKEMAVQVEDLQGRNASLERSKLAQESSAQKEFQRHQEEAKLLQEENRRLELQLQDVQQFLSSSQSLVLQQGTELKALRKQLANLQDSFEEREKAQGEMANVVKTQEASLQECRFSLEQLEADLQASKELIDRLHTELSCKEQRMVSFVAAKEEAAASAVLELQQQHKKELKELENQKSKAECEKVALEAEKAKAQEKADRLMEKLKRTHEESKQHKIQLDSFTKSMSSLQNDRDCVLEDYRQLEQRHLAAIMEKDQLIQEAAAENNALKEELRSLHGQMDDLHAENAKLDAELVRYREDLNQVISIKDNQQKQLLKTQLERVQTLEKEKAGVEDQLRESELNLASLQLSIDALQQEKRNMEQEVEALQSSLSQMQREMAAVQEGGPMLELQVQLQGKLDEVQNLGGQLLLAKQQVVVLEEELAQLQQTTSQKIHEAEMKMKKELKSFHHDTGLLRNETETAEERVAELAKDLLEMEQNLLAVTDENQDLKAQIQSFRKAMSSLQDSWDQTNDKLHTVEKKYAAELEEQREQVQDLQEEKLQIQEKQKTLEKERNSLATELAGLRHLEKEKGLLAELEKLRRQLQAKDSELIHLSSELEKASGQVKSFSQAMARLQAERDRLLSELDKARKMEDLKLQSAAGTSASLAEVLSLKRALSSLQDDRDRLLVELKKLQQEYLQVGFNVAEVMHLKAQLQQQKQESASGQVDLWRLREGKGAWERAEQQWDPPEAPPRTAVGEKQQAAPEMVGSRRTVAGDASGQVAAANDLQDELRSSLNDLHQKELRIQHLSSKLSQVLEEKSTLSLQLRGSSRSLRESQQCRSTALARCQALEKQLQELQLPVKSGGPLPGDAAPGAPQERSDPSGEGSVLALQQMQMQLLEAKQQQSATRQSLLQLQEQFQEEQTRRLAAEEAFSVAQEQLCRLESDEWVPSSDASITMPPDPEQALLLGPAEGSFSKARGGTGLRRVLRSVFCPRRLLSLLAMVYLFGVHLLLFLYVIRRL